MATIAENITATGQQILLPIIRQVYPSMIAHQILSVQPMSPTALDFNSIFNMKFTFDDPNIAKFHKKYKFSRAKWYYCKCKFIDGAKAYDWCREHFGPISKGGDAWMRWKLEINQFRFLNEDDAIMFKLRWGDAGTK
jgi:hypothetical protein